jgi:hypothetical protein
MSQHSCAAECDAALQQFRKRSSSLRWAWFWLKLLWLTLTTRRLTGLLSPLLSPSEPHDVEGLDNIPRDGSFVLALNHFRGASTLEVIAAVLTALQGVRPDAVEQMLIVTGRRTAPRKLGLVARLFRSLINWGLGRWSHNNVRITKEGGPETSLAALKQWRQWAKTRPSLVFPEGQAHLTMASLRPGSGLWLRALPVPAFPVAVWWADGQWHIRFGEQLDWVQKKELSDVQLGLAIADMLPAELTPYWNPLRQRLAG